MDDHACESDLCAALNIHVPCCVSCHEDQDHGYPMNTVKYEGQDISVCCAVYRAFVDIMGIERPPRKCNG